MKYTIQKYILFKKEAFQKGQYLDYGIGILQV